MTGGVITVNSSGGLKGQVDTGRPPPSPIVTDQIGRSAKWFAVP
jgi:hypothetical protein